MANKKILFLCLENATRSLMAEAIFRHLFGQHWEVFSAGLNSGGPHPLMLSALAERGIQTNALVSKNLSELPRYRFDVVVTLSPGADDLAQELEGNPFVVHLPFDDPAQLGGNHEERADAFRRVRDQIFGRLNVMGHRMETELICEEQQRQFKNPLNLSMVSGFF
ncbi:MAG: arsenate reductase ArsC [bacterium]|nr:arsenate reductase ArsC [bacterium]